MVGVNTSCELLKGETMATLPNLNWTQYKQTLADAYKPRPSIQYVLPGVFALPSLNFVYGSPGCLKSFLIADLALCVVTGKPWLESIQGKQSNIKPFPVLQGKVIWIDQDNGGNRTANRFEALGKAYGASPAANLEYYSMPQPLLDASKTGHVIDLISLTSGSKMIVIDNLATISGGRDENSSEMMEVMSNLRLLSERTGAVVIIIHHSRKETGYKGKQGDNLRGFSGIRGAIDTGLYVDREPASDSITVTAEKARDMSIPTFGAMFTYTHKAGCNDLETARFFGEETAKGNTTADIQNEIIQVLTVAGKPLSQTQVAKIVNANLGIGINKIRGILSSMGMTGIIKMSTKNNGSGYEYSIP